MGKLIVTIARQYGSGGKTIGQMLAENLGVNCYNREILRMASDDSGIKEELFNQADEKLRNNPLFGNSTRIYKGGLIQPDHGGFVSADNLFNYQAKVIKELAEKESCVFIGRCADFVLKDRPDVMSVFYPCTAGLLPGTWYGTQLHDGKRDGKIYSKDRQVSR